MARYIREHPPEVRERILAMLATGEVSLQELKRKEGVAPSTIRRWRDEAAGRPPTADREVGLDIDRDHEEGPASRILIYDIETLPNRGYFFDCFSPNRSIPLQFIDREKSICTIAYKWLGEEDAKVITIADFPQTFKDPYNDSAVLRTFLPIWEQAYYTVAHYGDKFDKRFIAARLMANKLPSLPPVQTVDTYKLAKKHLLLNSNKLDHLGTILGVGNKNKTSAELWVNCAKGQPEAIAEMAAYNRQDVQLLEEVFVRLLPHVQSRINLNLSVDEPIQRCKQCGSSNIELRGFELTAASLRHRYSCRDCGSWSVFPKRKRPAGHGLLDSVRAIKQPPL